REVIRALVRGGMNVARINFSHGTHAEHVQTIEKVRGIAQELTSPVAILGDLQGPRIRIGEMVEPVNLTPGTTITLAPEAEARPPAIPVTYHRLAEDVRSGNRILIDDGLLELLVE